MLPTKIKFTLQISEGTFCKKFRRNDKVCWWTDVNWESWCLISFCVVYCANWFYRLFLIRVSIVRVSMAIAPVFYYPSRFCFRGNGRSKRDLTNCLISIGIIGLLPGLLPWKFFILTFNYTTHQSWTTLLYVGPEPIVPIGVALRIHESVFL
jgi:hypothetical protein